MTVQTEYEQAYHKRLAAIEADPQLTVLSSMNQPQESDQNDVRQYIVFTDFKAFMNKKQTELLMSTHRLKMLTNMAIRKQIIRHSSYLKRIAGTT